MCDLCNKAKNSVSYSRLLSSMLHEDKKRLETTKSFADDLSILNKRIYSSMKWPVKLVYPMFETRAAYAVPNNYFQNLLVGNEKAGNSFAHGAMRSIFFAGDRLVVFSKSVNFREGKEFFTSFILLHLEKDEYQQEKKPDGITIKTAVKKPMKNLITGETEKREISFFFMHKNVENRIVSKERAAATSRFKKVYEKYGGVDLKAGSMDLEGYAITVPHFSPHPYLLQLSQEFGYGSNREFQLHVKDYFEKHLDLVKL